MRKILLTIALSVCSAVSLHGQSTAGAGLAGAGGATNVVDEVIWVVGDDAIMLSDVEEQRISAEMQGENIENPYCVIPEQMAVQKLYLHQADLDSIEADESNIIRYVDERINMFIQNFGSKENVEAYARKSLSALREGLKQRERDNMRAERMQAKLCEHIKVTPAEVREYFKAVPEDSLPLVPTKVEVQIITYRPEPTRAEIERVESTLREYARRVTSGETEFSTLARFYSACPSARNGGELGYSGKGEWLPEFASAAFALNDPKKVSKIVKTEDGYHIIQLIGKRGDKVNVRHILLKPQIEEEEFAKGLAKLDTVRTKLQAGEATFEDAAAVLSDDKDSRNNRGLMAYTDRQTGSITSRFQMSELPPDVAKVVDTLSVGELSAPFRMTNERGQQYCAIVKLKARYMQHRAGVTEDFQLLRDIVTAKRRAARLREWIAQKQRSTFIRINPEWRGCDFEYPGWVK